MGRFKPRQFQSAEEEVDFLNQVILELERENADLELENDRLRILSGQQSTGPRATDHPDVHRPEMGPGYPPIVIY